MRFHFIGFFNKVVCNAFVSCLSLGGGFVGIVVWGLGLSPPAYGGRGRAIRGYIAALCLLRAFGPPLLSLRRPAREAGGPKPQKQNEQPMEFLGGGIGLAMVGEA